MARTLKAASSTPPKMPRKADSKSTPSASARPAAAVFRSGTISGATMYHQDASGQQVVSKLDENTLRQIADLTGGAYATARPARRRARRNLPHATSNRCPSKISRSGVKKSTSNGLSGRWVWLFYFSMWEFIITERSSTAVRPTPCLPAPPAARVRAPPPGPNNVAATTSADRPRPVPFRLRPAPPIADTAERDYKSGKYEDADAELPKGPPRSSPSAAISNTIAAMPPTKPANIPRPRRRSARRSRRPTSTSRKTPTTTSATPNSSTAQTMQKVDTKKTINLWEQALHSYDSALKLKTTADARHNYEYVKEKLEQLKQQQQQQQQQNKSGQSNPNDKDQNGPEFAAEPGRSRQPEQRPAPGSAGATGPEQSAK